MSAKPNTIIAYKLAFDKMKKKEFLVTLEIPLENNLHNMNRPNIVDINFAKMRAQKATVLKIEHLRTGESLFDDATVYSLFNPHFSYKKGETVNVTNFDRNINDTCSTGIHFFLCKDAVLNHAGSQGVGSWTLLDFHSCL